MRLFVAIGLPDQVKERLAKVVAQLRTPRADVRWIPTESMHLTLKFLGNVDVRDVGAVDAAVNRVADAARSTRGRLCGLGSFPHLRRPRVLWIGARTGDAALATLYAALQAELAGIGFPVDRRGFHPHVTLGRARSDERLPELRAVLNELRSVDAGDFPIDALTLFESELRSGGARYNALGVHALGGAEGRT
jgi:2'-5' RNA ligase